MAVVVFLKGANVGGRRLRPSALAKELDHLDVLSIGAAGTFVVREPIARAMLRREFADRMPFDAQVTIRTASEILRLLASDPFDGHAEARDIVSFVGVMATRGRGATSPLQLPARGEWHVKVLNLENRFVLGQYRRRMKSISYLSALERILGAPLTIRNWSTMRAIGRALEA